MKLSEAIRLGAMLKPQGFGVGAFYSSVATCAMGAALDALGAHSDDWATEMCARYQVLSIEGSCPECDKFERVISRIWHLNDTHRWTREQIADWVETLEPRDVEAPEPAPVCAAGGRER